MTSLLWFTLAWAGGILLAQANFFHWIWFLLAVPATMVLLVGWGDRREARVAALCMIGALLGAARLQLAEIPITGKHIACYNGVSPVAIEGVVVGEPDRRGTYVNLRLRAETLQLPEGGAAPATFASNCAYEAFTEPAGTPVEGLLLVRAPVEPVVHYGDRLRVTGALAEPPVFDTFSYKDYLARQGIHAMLPEARVEVLAEHQASRLLDGIYRFKAHALDRLHEILPAEPHSSLLAGILLGVERGISDDVNEAFTATGTSHIIAISGFNLTIVAGLLASLARRVFKGRGEVALSIAALWLYTVLVGASAAVLRAAVMATVALVARSEERKSHGPTSLAAAALVMSLLNPHVLWDVGFQLSLAATAGLILYTEPLTAWFLRRLQALTDAEKAARIVGVLSDALIVTLAAQITTTPILIAAFRRVSLITLLTNGLILPVQPWVMIFGGAALIVGLVPGVVLLPLAQALGWITWVFLAWTLCMVRWTATLPLASVALGDWAKPLVVGYYLALGVGTWWFRQSGETHQRVWRGLKRLAQWQVAAGGAALVAFFAFLYTVPDGHLHVHVLDVGQGDAVLIQTPGGRQVLVDGGADAPTTLARLSQALPFWDRRIDLVVLTAPEESRIAGLIPVLERYTVDFVITEPAAPAAEASATGLRERWAALVSERPPGSVGTLYAGATWDLGDDVALHALWPEPGAEQGPLVLRLTHDGVSFLLPGAATTLVEDQLVAHHGRDLHSDVLQLARHGARSGSTVPFLQAVDPEIAVISAGEDKRSPDPAVLARLMDRTLYRTDEHGTVEFISDGRSVRVRTASRHGP